jgi:heparanase
MSLATALLSFLFFHQSVNSQIQLSFTTSSPLHRVDERYVCFNIDTGSLYNGMNFSDTTFRTLVNQLTFGGSGKGSIIRIGGTAVDSSFYFPDAPYNIGEPNQCGGNCPNGSSDIGNAMLNAVFDFIIATDMNLLWDVNGASFRDGTGPWNANGNATAMLSYLDSKYAGSIDFAYSVGNEPDLWKPPHNGVSSVTLGKDALAMKAALAPLNIGKDVYGSSWAGINSDDAQGFLPTVVAGGGITGLTVHNYPYGGRDCVVSNYLDKSKITSDMAKKLEAVAAVKASTPGAESILLVLEETAGSSGGGCDNVTDRFVAGFCWLNTLITVGRSGFDRVHRQDIAGWSFAFGESHYQLVGPPGWVVGSQLLTPHPDYWTTLLWRQLVGYSVLNTNVTGGNQALLDSVDLSLWCAAPNTSPYGSKTVILAFTVMSTDTDISITLPDILQTSEMTQYFLTAPNDDLQSDDIQLNGQTLTLGEGGKLLSYPIMGKTISAGQQSILLSKLSYGFIAFDTTIAACS